MRANVGRWDQVIRILVGLGLIVFGVMDRTQYRWIGLAGVVLVATGFVRFCPAYWIMRIRTAARPAAPITD